MPLMTMREEIPLNVWDSFSPRDPALYDTESPYKLFIGRHTGDIIRSNQVCGGLIVAPDQRALLLNWYARSTSALQKLDPDAWKVWTNLTIVTFILGTSPIVSMNLHDLLERRAGQPLIGNVPLADVPSRQICDVRIQSPCGVLPTSDIDGTVYEMVWIHLEGVAIRLARPITRSEAREP